MLQQTKQCFNSKYIVLQLKNASTVKRSQLWVHCDIHMFIIGSNMDKHKTLSQENSKHCLKKYWSSILLCHSWRLLWFGCFQIFCLILLKWLCKVKLGIFSELSLWLRLCSHFSSASKKTQLSAETEFVPSGCQMLLSLRRRQKDSLEPILVDVCRRKKRQPLAKEWAPKEPQQLPVFVWPFKLSATRTILGLLIGFQLWDKCSYLFTDCF